jgi:hypothetical protein
MIYFINKETLNITYNFIYLNKYFEKDESNII